MAGWPEGKMARLGFRLIKLLGLIGPSKTAISQKSTATAGLTKQPISKNSHKTRTVNSFTWFPKESQITVVPVPLEMRAVLMLLAVIGGRAVVFMVKVSGGSTVIDRSETFIQSSAPLKITESSKLIVVADVSAEFDRRLNLFPKRINDWKPFCKSFDFTIFAYFIVKFLNFCLC